MFQRLILVIHLYVNTQRKQKLYTLLKLIKLLVPSKQGAQFSVRYQRNWVIEVYGQVLVISFRITTLNIKLTGSHEKLTESVVASYC